MADDVLRMRATVVSDEALAKIRELAREGGLLPQRMRPGFNQLNDTTNTLTRTFSRLTSEIRAAVPVLGSVGLGTAGVGAAAYALFRTLSSLSDKMVQLKYASQELGIAENVLRGYTEAASKVGIAPEAFQASMEGFKQTTVDFKYHMGAAREEIISMGGGPVVAAIEKAASQTDKLKEAWKFKDTLLEMDKTGDLARDFFTKLHLGPQLVRLSWAQMERAIKSPISASEQEQADRFHDTVVELGTAWDDFLRAAGKEIFPGLTTAIKGMASLLRIIDTITDLIGPGLGRRLGLIDAKPEERAAKTPTEEASPQRYNLYPRRGGGDERLRPAPMNFTPQGGVNPLLQHQTGIEGGSVHPVAFTEGGAGLGEFSRGVKDGVFAALVDFQSYVGAGGGGGDGFQKASLTTGGGLGGIGAGGGGYGESRGGGGGAGGGGEGGGTPSGGPAASRTVAPQGGGGESGGGEGPQTNLTPGTGGGTSGAIAGAPMGGDIGPQAALAMARTHLGEDEMRDQSKLQDFFRSKGIKINPRTTAWCAAFVNANLAERGIKGTGSLAAGSFTKYGTAVDPKDVQAGDIGVVRGTSPRTGVEGKHVGLLTGETRMRNGQLEVKMLAGNENVEGSKGKVAETWRRASTLHLRRPPAPSDSPEGRATAAGPTGGGGSASDRRVVKGSVFGTGHGFHDPSEPAGRKTASGVPNTVPGIALPSREGLGKMFEVTTPDGRTFMLPQTDVGPAKRTGRGIDITAAAAAQMGYTSKTFPTDAGFGFRRIDEAVAANNLNATGTVNVNVHAPRGTKTSADSDGMFQNTNIKNYRQMQPTTEPIVGPG